MIAEGCAVRAGYVYIQHPVYNEAIIWGYILSAFCCDLQCHNDDQRIL